MILLDSNNIGEICKNDINRYEYDQLVIFTGDKVLYALFKFTK
jgi:hypothetical protein